MSSTSQTLTYVATEGVNPSRHNDARDEEKSIRRNILTAAASQKSKVFESENTNETSNAFSNGADSAIRNLRVIQLPRFSYYGTRGETFAAMQEWEGCIVSSDKEKFVAQLIDITAGADESDEFVEILCSDLDDSDQQKVRPGAIFRWVIGYAKNASGTKTRGSRIYFRRKGGVKSSPDAADLVFEE